MEAQWRYDEDPAHRPLSTSDLVGAAEPSAVEEEGSASRSGGEPLLPEGEASSFRSRWDEVQAGFVDRPRESVQAADALVAEVMRRLAEGFADARSGLERQWDRGDQVSTEDLRVSLQRYRSFFQRLLAA
jgi:glutathione S-transferase